MSYLVFLPFGCIAWVRPVLGYALFMLLQTPLGNLAETFVNPQLQNVVLILATIRIITRRPYRRLSGAEGCALALSVVVILRNAFLLDSDFALGECWRLLSYGFLWGPLLIAFNRFDGDEVAALRVWMGVAGTVVGVWGLLIYMTGNSYLMRMAIWGDPETTNAISTLANSDSEQIVKGRFIVMGLFTVCTYAYWYALRNALARTPAHWLLYLVTWGGVGAMLVAVGVSVTRSSLILLGMGTALVLSVQLLILTGSKKRRDLVQAGILGATLVCAIGFAIYAIDFTAITTQFQERFSTLSTEDENLQARLDNTASAWAYLRENLCLLGSPNLDTIASVDTAVILRVWLLYGIPGVLLFSTLFLTAFWHLFRSWLVLGLSPEQRLLRGMLTAWGLTYVYIWIFGYSMHPPEVFFTMLFFSEISRLKDKFPSPTNIHMRRIAA